MDRGEKVGRKGGKDSETAQNSSPSAKKKERNGRSRKPEKASGHGERKAGD